MIRVCNCIPCTLCSSAYAACMYGRISWYEVSDNYFSVVKASTLEFYQINILLLANVLQLKIYCQSLSFPFLSSTYLFFYTVNYRLIYLQLKSYTFFRNYFRCIFTARLTSIFNRRIGKITLLQCKPLLRRMVEYFNMEV